jgi:Mn-dependent DtxR family transcriptional regulator
MALKNVACGALLWHTVPMPPPRRQSKASKTARSESTEDHLERIAELVERKGYARVTDVAEALRVKPSTVSNMVRRLAARGFVNYEKYRGFSLTTEGRSVAARIKARHATLTELFSLMRLKPGTIEQEVEDIEHHLRPQTLAVLAKLVAYWKSHPGQLKSFLQFSRKK